MIVLVLLSDKSTSMVLLSAISIVLVLLSDKSTSTPECDIDSTSTPECDIDYKR